MTTTELSTPITMPLERLEAEITELCGHLTAGECRWLLLVAEFDRRAGWEQWGCRSCAHWLSWHCGLDRRAGREKVRVARALEERPRITEAFAAGKLSYSKVRALTRIATPANEAELVMLAEHATAVEVERIVRAYRGVKSAEEERDQANETHAARHVRLDPNDDGTFAINGRVPPEVAAILLAAFNYAREHLPADALGEGGPAGPPRTNAATNVDALVMMAETLLAHGPSARNGGDRYQIVVNIDDDVLVDDEPGGISELDHGSHLAPETVRRLMCDASIVFMLHDESGRPANVTNKTRTIPAALRRAVHARDQGCRFPGCGERTYVEIHHATHRAHGGTNELGNLIELCWFHHHLVHEGRWAVRLDPDGVVVAIHPDGNLLPPCRPTEVADDRGVEHRNHHHGITIEPDTCIPRWYRDPLDLNTIIGTLWDLDHRPT